MSGLETWPFTTHEFRLPLRYRLSGPADKGVVICLHGYQDHAASMLRRLGWQNHGDLPFRLLAVNGPFPVPIWSEDTFTEAYAWYFRDATRGVEVGSPEMTARAISELMTELGLLEQPAVVFGFSQGGFLAPTLARRLPDARSIICFGGGFPDEAYRGLKTLPVFGVHGAADARVPLAGAKSGHEQLRRAGFGGRFIEIPGLGHRLTPAVAPLLRDLIDESFR